MTPEYGAAMQLEKIDMLDYADFVAINKFDRPKALDALRDVRKQYRRCHELFDGPDDDELPVYATIASQFHDHGVNALYQGLVSRFAKDFGKAWTLEGTSAEPAGEPERHPMIPGERAGYLREISRAVRGYKEWAEDQIQVAAQLYQLVGARAILCAREGDGDIEDLWNLFEEILGRRARHRAPARRHRRRDPPHRPPARGRLARADRRLAQRSATTTPATTSPTPSAARSSTCR